MSTQTAWRDGGKTSEEGASRLFQKMAGIQNKGYVTLGDLAVTQNGAGAMSVIIAPGDLIIPYLNYQYHSWNTANVTLTIAAADATYHRWSRIIAYIDLSVVSAVSANNPGVLKFLEVAGTPSGTPAVPADSAVQTAVGAGNPWVELARIDVGNTVTQILTSNITDKRTRFLLGSSGAIPPFSIPGNLVAQTGGFMPNWIVPPGIPTINRLDAILLTAPVGANVTAQVYNVTQNLPVGQVTITAGNRIGSNASMSNPSLNAGDELRFDILNVGSTTPGADLLVQPSA